MCYQIARLSLDGLIKTEKNGKNLACVPPLTAEAIAADCRRIAKWESKPHEE